MANSVAYDLSRFEDRPRAVILEKVETKKQNRVIGFSLKKLLFVGVIIVAITFVMIYNRVMLTEITDEIAQANKTLSTIQSENALLEMEIAQKMSLDNIEEYATQNLNMGKVEQYQVESISLTQNDEIAVMKDDSQTNFFSTIYARIFGHKA